MAELKTKETKASVGGFLKQIPDASRRKDAEKILALMKSVTKEEPKMWGSSIIGFGRLHYVKNAPGAKATGSWPGSRRGRIPSPCICVAGSSARRPDVEAGQGQTGVGCLT